MTWKPSDKPLREPLPTSEEQIDRNVAEYSAIEDAALRCRVLQWYVRWLLAPRPKGRGRLANPKTHREQILSDWTVYEEVERVRKELHCGIPKACATLARGRRGEDPGKVLNKAYNRHRDSPFGPPRT
jgi:hypothetical protein